MSATTQNAKDDPMGRWTTVTHGLTIGGTDLDISTIWSCGIAHRIYCSAAGNVAVQRVGDTGFTAYAVLQGTYLEGKFTKVGGTSSGSTAIAIVLELATN